MIDIIIYASKVFITPNIILKDTPITKRPRPDFFFWLNLLKQQINNMLMTLL
jgi:hypothetical protein